MPVLPNPVPGDCVQLDAVDEVTGKIVKVLLRRKKMDETAKRGRGQTLELAYTVPEVLKAPCTIFRGVREVAEDSWLCYSGTPDHAYDYKTCAKRGPWRNQVFLVFVNDDAIVYNWRWERCDPDDHRRPINWKDRFKEVAL